MPVGIVDCTWGGTRVEGWTNREILETYPDIDLTEKGIEAMTDWLRPMVMYNAMLHPVAGYTVRGFLWYQGESNVNQYKDYAVRLSNMVGLWRSLWKQGDIPFLARRGRPRSPVATAAAMSARSAVEGTELI